MITLIADEGHGTVGQELFREFGDQGVPVEYISLENVDVKPCVNCTGCTYKSYNRCVARDDADWILPKVIRTDVLVMVTPITYGGYSFKAKRLLDKLGLIMDRTYRAQKKELVKGGLVGRQFVFFALGVREDCLTEEEDVFIRLHRETVHITRGIGNAFVVDPILLPVQRAEIVHEVAGV